MTDRTSEPTAREALHEQVRWAVEQWGSDSPNAEADALIDAYAHELAEKQRAWWASQKKRGGYVPKASALIDPGDPTKTRPITAEGCVPVYMTGSSDYCERATVDHPEGCGSNPPGRDGVWRVPEFVTPADFRAAMLRLGLDPNSVMTLHVEAGEITVGIMARDHAGRPIAMGDTGLTAAITIPIRLTAENGPRWGRPADVCSDYTCHPECEDLMICRVVASGLVEMPLMTAQEAADLISGEEQ